MPGEEIHSGEEIPTSGTSQGTEQHPAQLQEWFPAAPEPCTSNSQLWHAGGPQRPVLVVLLLVGWMERLP